MYIIYIYIYTHAMLYAIFMSFHDVYGLFFGEFWPDLSENR